MPAYYSEILDTISCINRDNGRSFTCTDRLNAIQSLLWDSRYRRINPQGLYHLYAAKPLEEMNKPVILVTSHVDCEINISRCFNDITEDGYMIGTFDNSLTNAAILHIMLYSNIPDNVVIAFTGDEEGDGTGIKQAAKFLDNTAGIEFAFVLDVTDMAWDEGADFTIENDFFDDDEGYKIVSLLKSVSAKWYYVPADPADVPDYVYQDRVIPIASADDESWDLDDLNIDCCSICVPVRGEMHSDRGVLARKSSIPKYIEAIEKLLRFW